VCLAPVASYLVFTVQGTTNLENFFSFFHSFLGEIAAQRIYGGEITHTYEYDLILSDGRTADVKTKRTSTAPKDYYDCSVANFNPRQNCNIYIFCRVHYDNSKAWVLGHYDKEQYIKDARFLRRGEQDGDNGFIVRADCYNMAINQLEKPMTELEIQ
jgi:hypothetical protein